MTKVFLRVLASAIFILASLNFAQAQQWEAATWPTPHEGDYIIHDFHFLSGETMPEVRMHYTTLASQ